MPDKVIYDESIETSAPVCPISGEPIRVPVITNGGRVFELVNLVCSMMSATAPICPLSRSPIETITFVEDLVVAPYSLSDDELTKVASCLLVLKDDFSSVRLDGILDLAGIAEKLKELLPDSNQNTERMNVALRQGELDTIKQLVDEGVTFDDYPLYLAACCGHLHVVDFLLKLPAVISQVNLEDPDIGITPLYVAASGGHLGMVEVLLKTEGISVNKVNSRSEHDTPLSIAAAMGHTDIVYVLLRKLAELDWHQAVDAAMTVLQKASSAKKKGVEKLVLQFYLHEMLEKPDEMLLILEEKTILFTLLKDRRSDLFCLLKKMDERKNDPEKYIARLNHITQTRTSLLQAECSRTKVATSPVHPLHKIFSAPSNTPSFFSKKSILDDVQKLRDSLSETFNEKTKSI